MTLAILVVCLVPVIGLLIYACARAWPPARDQGKRMRQDGGPRGADFDTFVERKMEELPVGRRGRAGRGS